MDHGKGGIELDIESILGQLANIHPRLVKRCWGDCDPYESICGMISSKIVGWMIETFPEITPSVFYRDGLYVGPGTEYSGGPHGTSHCWVEITLEDKKRIIIDGAYAQFFPKETSPDIKDRVRLAIFHPNDERQKWYKKG